jgi:hypothetical protein
MNSQQTFGMDLNGGTLYTPSINTADRYAFGANAYAGRPSSIGTAGE